MKILIFVYLLIAFSNPVFGSASHLSTKEETPLLKRQTEFGLNFDFLGYVKDIEGFCFDLSEVSVGSNALYPTLLKGNPVDDMYCDAKVFGEVFGYQWDTYEDRPTCFQVYGVFYGRFNQFSHYVYFEIADSYCPLESEEDL